MASLLITMMLTSVLPSQYLQTQQDTLLNKFNLTVTKQVIWSQC